MTLLAADTPCDLPSPSASRTASPMALVSLSRRSASASSSLFRPWAAGEAASEAASEASDVLVQCSPPVGICAGLRTSRSTKPRPATAPATLAESSGAASPKASVDADSSTSRQSHQSQPILTRLEGLVATLDESSQSSRSSSRSSSSKSTASSSSCGNGHSGGSCPPSPARDLRTFKSRGSSSGPAGKKAARSSAFSTPSVPGGSGGPGSGCPAPSAAPNVMLSLSPEEVAILAAQQQAFHEEALLAMAGLLPPGTAPPGLPPGALLPPEGLPAMYLDEYARLLQQEQKAQGAAARKQRPKKYRCPHCQVAFSNNGQLRGHVRIHTGERPFKCEEESCGKRFTRNEELTRHKRIHSGQRPFACAACGKRFGRKDHLKKHARTHDPAHRMAHMLPVLPPAHYLYGF